MNKTLSLLLMSSVASTTAFAGTTGLCDSNRSSIVCDDYKLGQNILIHVIDAPIHVK